ncbi:hypothetical protein NJH78_03970 [Pseudomonas chlororaphis]|uniref:hypothetical protein n=1 Tax=Pseudomonas chlororaphis TaxID=587753 RepID=UPI00209B3A72|nr:hypothetical protein [Pseudomonas chlororaphis]MCO7569123.1 hypothetical protein [Pseudomonas chlororaphis]MCO7587032.1 hypothetical protein [Pseudomonas chlororaphis]
MANPLWSHTATTTPSRGAPQRVTVDITRYVNKIHNESGWLLVGMDNVPRENWPQLFKYCKVTLITAKDNKTYFNVLEGAHKGKVAFLSETNAKEHLGKIAPKQKPIELVMNYERLDQNWKSITRNEHFPQQIANGNINNLNFKATMNTVWNGIYFPIPAGTYKILLPDFPHSINYTQQYKKEFPNLSHHQVWFPIDHGDRNRYVHVGNVSEGCITVISLDKWSEIQEMLISHRSSDGKSVGNLIVKGKPERAK